MVKSVVEQKMALAAYASETGIVTLSPTQLDLIDNIIASLSPIVTGFWKNDPNRTLEVPR